MRAVSTALYGASTDRGRRGTRGRWTGRQVCRSNKFAHCTGRSDVTRTVVILASYAESLLNFRGPLLQALQVSGYRVLACAPECAATREKLSQMGIEFFGTPLRRASIDPFSDLGYFLRVIALLRRQRPIAIISYTAKPVIWGSMAARVAGIAKICAMITGVGSAMMMSKGATSRALAALYRLALHTCERVAFQNPDDEAEFVRRGLVSPTQAFRVNGSGVLLDHFVPAPLPHDPVFLLIGRLLADKGIREYSAAARVLKQKYPNARFRLAGWFDNNPSALRREEVEGWVREGIIEYAGRLEDVRPELTKALVYVLPSYREGTPRTVLEAMAMGRPVITTDAPGCRETVRHDWNGWLVPPRDSQQLASAMERFIVTPRLAEQMGRNSRALAVSRFDANVVAKELLAGFGL